MHTLQIKGDWNIIKGKLTQKWVNLTNDDLHYVVGEEDELIERIQKRTGESRESIDYILKKNEISELLRLAFPLLIHTVEARELHARSLRAFC